MKFRRIWLTSLTVVSIALAAALPARADIIAYGSTRDVGNQGWTGALGMDFNVKAGQSIWVTQLGAYDSGQNGFGNDSIQVGIFNRNGGSLMGVAATLTGSAQPLDGFSRYFDITDFMLTAGDYSIVAYGFNAANPNGNAGNGGSAPSTDGAGAIDFVNNSRYGPQGGGFAYPTILDGGPAARYDAGTFKFSVANTVPEPQSLLLVLLALGAGAFASKRKT